MLDAGRELLMADEPRPDSRFRRSEWLTLKRDFDEIFGIRRSAAGRCLIIYASRNDLGYNRLGLVVGRKAGPAPTRNRFKRLVREAFRLTKNDQPVGWNWIALPRLPKKGSKPATPPSSDWSLDQFRTEIVDLMHRLARSRGGEPRNKFHGPRDAKPSGD